MVRQIGIGLLISVLALAGLVTCPRGGSCLMARSTTPDCCRQHVALQAADCCCSKGQQVRATGTLTGQEQAVPTLWVATAPSGYLDLCARAPVRSRPLTHGLAPPDTPVSRHVTLLL